MTEDVEVGRVTLSGLLSRETSLFCGGPLHIGVPRPLL